MNTKELATADPVKLGSILFTLVEPHKGHEVAYHRWYERDHFYAGCMIGPYNFAGRRFVSTRDLKGLRYPAESEITSGPSARGSYLALYWALALDPGFRRGDGIPLEVGPSLHVSPSPTAPS